VILLLPCCAKTVITVSISQTCESST
jgi:hypothetical protein